MKKSKNPCSPKIWRKFNAAEKRIWKRVYRQLLQEPAHIPGMKVDKAHLQAFAHNAACIATWESRNHRKAAVDSLGKFLVQFGGELKKSR